MKENEMADSIKQIHTIMRRSTTFLSLSGLSGVSAGICGILAGFILSWKLSSWVLNFTAMRLYFLSPDFEIFVFVLLSASLVLALTLAFIFSYLKSRKKNLPIFDQVSLQFAFYLFLPLISGGLFILAMLLHGTFSYLFSSMLLFFGIALFNSSKFTLDEIKYLGIMEIILGLISVYFINLGLICWTVGFGLLNMIYGIIMFMKYEK